MHDLLIRGGTVVDGTGAAARTADIAVDDGVIVEVGKVSGSGRRTIDADGLLVTPGFVDIHTHFDGQATWDPHLTPSCWHGVTTAVLGNCGVGFAPVRAVDRDRLIEIMEGVEDIPGSALSEGIRWAWESFPEYLDALEAMPRAVNVAAQIPHAAIRAFALGERALDDQVNADDLAAMVSAVRDGLRAGAVGFSTGRTVSHRDVRGGLVPGTFAGGDEIRAMLAVLDEERRGVFQIVPAGVGGEASEDGAGAMARELEWIARAGVESSRPIMFLAMQDTARPDTWRDWFATARAANARGARIHPQVGSRCFGMLMGLESRVNPLQGRPAYDSIAHLPLAEKVAKLRHAEVREQILAETPRPGRHSVYMMDDEKFRRLYPLGQPLDYEPTDQASVMAIAERAGTSPWEIVYDLLLRGDGHDFMIYPFLNYGHGSYDDLFEMITDPMSVQGLGDGGAHCSAVCDASLTTYLISHWVRDRTRGSRVPLEYAVQRLTRDPAELYGFADRGVIASGMRADLNVIDFDALALHMPERITDLPGGAGRLVQRSDGYHETIVAGQTIVDHGELTDARPGTLLRGSVQS